MMHYDHTIVTLRDLSNRQTFRELGHRRSGQDSFARVVMPFGTEYGFQFKFQDGIRRRLELRIDGTLITDSLILSGSAVLERFMDSDRRFKFVPADHADVADPTSPDNGNIEIRLWKETQPVWVQPATDFYDVYHKGPMPGAWGQGPTGRSGIRGSSPLRCMSFGGGAMGGGTQSSCNVPQNLSLPTCDSFVPDCNVSNTAAGATVEGGYSSQKFGSTEWRGDAGEALVFRFKLEGRMEVAPKTGYCPGCGTKLKGSPNYCPNCGAKQ